MFIPQQGAGSYLPESMLQPQQVQPSVQQQGGILNQTPHTAYQPNFSMLYNPQAMLEEQANFQPSFTGGMFNSMLGSGTPQQGFQQPMFTQEQVDRILSDWMASSGLSGGGRASGGQDAPHPISGWIHGGN